jgi:hypothetical protein
MIHDRTVRSAPTAFHHPACARSRSRVSLEPAHGFPWFHLPARSVTFALACSHERPLYSCSMSTRSPFRIRPANSLCSAVNDVGMGVGTEGHRSVTWLCFLQNEHSISAPKASLEARYAKFRFFFFASERRGRCAACRDVRGGSDFFLTAQFVVRLVGRRAFCVPLQRTRHPEIGSMALAARGAPSGTKLHIAAVARTCRIRARVGGASWCSRTAPSCARAERCCIHSRVSSRGPSAPGRDCRAPVAQRTVPSPSSPGLPQQPQLSQPCGCSRTLSGTNCFG